MVIADFAFVTGGRNILVLAAHTDNDVVLVDMDANFRTRKINVAPSATESTAASSGSRQVEWAIDTDYVWVSGGATEEQYIIHIENDIDTAKVTRTLSDARPGKMIFVNNYERVSLLDEMEDKLLVVDDKDDSPLNEMVSNMSRGNDTLGTVGVAVLAVADGSHAHGDDVARRN